jgi:hypothetical protein
MKRASSLFLAVATAATVMAMSVPAEARRHYRGHDGIDAGDVIAGALIIGGIAAVAAAASDDRYDDGYRGGRRTYDDDYGWYRGGYGSRAAVDQCVRAATRQAYRYGDWARVTDVTRIDRIRGGYEIRGRIVVQDRGWRGGWRGGWDRGHYFDRYGDGYDKGRFTCLTRYGSVRDVDLRGLRTL